MQDRSEDRPQGRNSAGGDAEAVDSQIWGQLQAGRGTYTFYNNIIRIPRMLFLSLVIWLAYLLLDPFTPLQAIRDMILIIVPSVVYVALEFLSAHIERSIIDTIRE